FIVPIGIGDQAAVRAWPQGWFRQDHQWLKYPSSSNLHWLRQASIELEADYDPARVSNDQADRILDAFGLFGSPDHCAERLVRAREEIGLRQAFLFPAHTHASHYELPRAEVEAFGEVIGPALGV